MHRSKSKFIVYVKAGVVLALLYLAFCGFSKLQLSGGEAEASAFGPSAAHTNAPGETNCTACHTTFPLNSGDGSVTISGLPANYLPGQQVPVTVTVTDENGVVYGSQTTALDTAGKAAGSFTEPAGNPATMQVIFGLVNGAQRPYIEHTHDGIIPTQAGTKSWTFMWTAPSQRVGKIDLYTAANAANGDGSTNNDLIYSTSASTLSGTAVSNFDSDTKTDVAIWRPSSGTWYVVKSKDGVSQAVQWGANGDKIVPGDYDGDGKTDFAIWRPSTGDWYLIESSHGIEVINWGIATDIPVPGDYDGDLKTDVAIFRPSTGQWFVRRSTDGLADVVKFGEATDKVVPGDYDADGKTDRAIFRPSTGDWYIAGSTSGVQVANWGVSTDKPVPGDYDGDGKTDIAVFRPSTGFWYLAQSTKGVEAFNWGVSTDTIVPADYDGDGKTDAAIFRAGKWWILQSSTNRSISVVDWGIAGDVPVPSAYLP